MGRPSSLTPEVCDKLEELLTLGVPVGIAVKKAGTSETAYYRRKNEDEAFAIRMDKAFATPAETILVALQMKAQNGDVKAATWLLERIYGLTEKKTIAHEGVSIEAVLAAAEAAANADASEPGE